MENFKEKQKEEAIKRLKLFDIYEDAIRQFKENNAVMVSERPYGALYELAITEKEIVKRFEKENEALVYLLTHTRTEFGELYEIFYVSKQEEEWDRDKKDVEARYPLVYVYNVDDEYASEFGYIGVTSRFGGLIRTA